MEQISSTSCHSLNIDDNEQQTKQQKKLQEIITSTWSLNHQRRSFKGLLPQIIASVIAASFNMIFGMSLTYSAILIPQLREQKVFDMTIAQSSLVASVVTLMVPIGATISGFFMDSIGRLNTIKLAAIPGVIGWIMIALANNVSLLIVGRLFTGLSAALGTAPAVVYITEIARSDMRGSLLSVAPAYGSLGMVLIYLKGWQMNWRTIAWSANIYTIVPCVLTIFIPESPAWLVSKGRNDEAAKSLKWINKYQSRLVNNKLQDRTLADIQLEALQLEHQKKVEESQKLGNHDIIYKLKAFVKPTGYKPFIILFFLFFFQQFCGIYVMLFYSVAFFQAMGKQINAYLMSVLIGTIRFIMSVVSTYLLGMFRRRPMIIASTCGLSIFMFLSAIFTMRLQQTATMDWLPMTALVFYVIFGMIGMLPIPWTMTAELFPIEIRGVAHSITYSVANLMMFSAVHSYETLISLFDGVVGIQFFFATIGTIGLIFTVLFLPETHGVKLTVIEEYFKHNTIYLGQKTIKVHQQKGSNSNNNNNNNHITTKSTSTRKESKDVKDTKDKEQNLKLILSE